MSDAQLGPAQGWTIISIINDKEMSMVGIGLQLFRGNKPIVLEGNENLPVPADDLVGRSELVAMAEHPLFIVSSDRIYNYMTAEEHQFNVFPSQYELVDRYLRAVSEGDAPKPYYLSDEESENFIDSFKDSMPMLADAISYID